MFLEQSSCTSEILTVETWAGFLHMASVLANWSRMVYVLVWYVSRETYDVHVNVFVIYSEEDVWI